MCFQASHLHPLEDMDGALLVREYEEEVEKSSDGDGDGAKREGIWIL